MVGAGVRRRGAGRRNAGLRNLMSVWRLNWSVERKTILRKNSLQTFKMGTGLAFALQASSVFPYLIIERDNVTCELLVFYFRRLVKDEVDQIKTGKKRRRQLDVVHDTHALVPRRVCPGRSKSGCDARKTDRTTSTEREYASMPSKKRGESAWRARVTDTG